MPDILLAVDIGNTRIKCGLFKKDRLLHTFTMASNTEASVASYCHSLRSHIGKKTPNRAGIASVVPALSESISSAIRTEFMILAEQIGTHLDTPFSISYKPPESLGADRLAGAVAACARYASDSGSTRTVVVVDAGTAINYEVVTSDGVYSGGAIAPGPGLLAHAMSTRTGKLPVADLEMPASAVGNSTGASMNSGLMFGFVDSVTGMLRRIKAEIEGPVVVVATGGWGSWLSEVVPEIDHFSDDLVLDGIRILLEQN